MILTLTANPSIDRTAELSTSLERGGVNRVVSINDGPGGKGINVSRALALADVPTTAVFPAPAGDPLVQAVTAAKIPFTVVAQSARVRTNLTITEPDGTTTKVNEPGAVLDSAAQKACLDVLLSAVTPGTWVALCGSVPPGPEHTWYSVMVKELKAAGAHVAVDTSDAPLVALAADLETAAPDVLKPNGLELGQLVDADGPGIEAAAEHGDFVPAAQAARKLVDRGVGIVLATLGAAGAVLVTDAGAWVGNPPPITPVSTVGAGDSSLAGLLLAFTKNLDPAECLRHAVAYGSGATALAGTGVPSPDQVDLDRTHVAQLPL